MQSRVYRPPTLRLALPPDATGGRPSCPVGHAGRPQFGAVRRHRPYFAHGPLSLALRLGPTPWGQGAHPMWATVAAIHLGPAGGKLRYDAIDLECSPLYFRFSF